MSTINAPAAREQGEAAWTGSKMVVWGGTLTGGGWMDDGGVYDPVSDTWTPTSMVGAPSARQGHTAVWSGSEFIVWGGNESSKLDTGGRYTP